MIKLYKKIGIDLHYWETWANDEKSSTVHWGIVGEEGESKTISSSLFSNHKAKIQKELNKVIKDGYAEIAADNHTSLIVLYTINETGTAEDLKKSHALEDKLEELLSSTGLGFCDGGGMGGDIMDVRCCVVDFVKAKKLIEENLKDTEFQDYSRIFEENK